MCVRAPGGAYELATGPVVAGALLLEGDIAMGANLIPVLLPGVVAAAIGYTMIVGICSWGGIPTTPVTVPDARLFSSSIRPSNE